MRVALGLLVLVGCSTPAPEQPASATLGSPISRFCASDDPCPGMTASKLEVCGECDPATRYFQRAICSLDGKLRKAVDSCVQARAGVAVSGKEVFGQGVSACVRQRLSNEPTVLKSYVAIASGHQAKEDEQRAWRDNCEARWAEHLGSTPGAVKRAATTGGLLLYAMKGAEVWIDGVKHPDVIPGESQSDGSPRPLALPKLSAGEHEIRLRVEDTYRLTTKVTVVADEERKLYLKMEPVPGCRADVDCVGHESGPACYRSMGRCSCASDVDCGKLAHSRCLRWYPQAPYMTCQSPARDD